MGSKGVEICCGQIDTDVIDKIDAEYTFCEEESSMLNRMYREYLFPDIAIYSYQEGENFIICMISISTEGISTPEGIELFMTKDDVFATYGNDVQQYMAQYYYFDGTTYLAFAFDENDNLRSIKYFNPYAWECIVKS